MPAASFETTTLKSPRPMLSGLEFGFVRLPSSAGFDG
jgi:hypothetical protein